jgi:hypothetical protein
MKRRTALGLLQGLVGKSLGEAEVALQRLTIYWNAGEMPVRWSEYVNYKLPGGKRLIGLSLSPAPTGMERVLAPMNNQYLVVVRDEQNANHSPLFPVGSWTDDPAGVWANVDEVLRTQLVIRSAYARGRSRDDRHIAVCDLFATWAARGEITDWAVDLGVGDGFWIKTTNGAETSKTLDVWWDELTQRADWPPHLWSA